jgi:short-subunit dehydrogenase
VKRKVIFITGVSSGFGHNMAKVLASKGHIVYGGSRREVYPIDNVTILPVDVTDANSVKSAIDQVVEQEGKIDILINNAGMGISGPIEEFSEGEIQLQMRTNFMGYVHTIKAVLPYMRKRKKGMIINISSIGGIMGLPYQGFYAASKFAVEGLSESLSMELKPYNIRVVVVRPGDFNTNFTQNRKLISALNEQSDYYVQAKTTLSVIENDERKGLHPELLAKKIARIVVKKKPKFSYIIATPEQRFAVFLKLILPRNMFFNILSSHYRIK